MQLRLQRFSYRFAEQVLNSKLVIKQEIEDLLAHPSIDISTLSRPQFNEVLKNLFVDKGWNNQPPVFDEPGDPSAKMDFLKERIGIDLPKSRVASYSHLDKIDTGIYAVTTRNFQRTMTQKHNHNWEGCLAFEKAVHYLPHFRHYRFFRTYTQREMLGVM